MFSETAIEVLDRNGEPRRITQWPCPAITEAILTGRRRSRIKLGVQIKRNRTRADTKEVWWMMRLVACDTCSFNYYAGTFSNDPPIVLGKADRINSTVFRDLEGFYEIVRLQIPQKNTSRIGSCRQQGSPV